MGGIEHHGQRKKRCKSSEGGKTVAGTVWEVEGDAVEGLGHNGPSAGSVGQ